MSRLKITVAMAAVIMTTACGSATPPAAAPVTVRETVVSTVLSTTTAISTTTALSTTTQAAPPTPTTAPSPPPPPPATTAPTPTPMTTAAPAPAPAPAISAVMPDVVCRNLQDAQNTIQAAGVFFSRSDDASGKGRAQVVDRNWVVVGQTPPAGAPVGELEAVLSVLKEGETSAC